MTPFRGRKPVCHDMTAIRQRLNSYIILYDQMWMKITEAMALPEL